MSEWWDIIQTARTAAPWLAIDFACGAVPTALAAWAARGT